MDKKFKWNMFITSFIPLWISIIISDIWSIVESGIENWKNYVPIFLNILNICKEKWICVFVIFVIGMLITISIVSINKFLSCLLGMGWVRFGTLAIALASCIWGAWWNAEMPRSCLRTQHIPIPRRCWMRCQWQITPYETVHVLPWQGK